MHVRPFLLKESDQVCQHLSDGIIQKKKGTAILEKWE